MMTHQHIVELSVGKRVGGVGLSSIDLEWLYGQGFFPETIGGSQHILRRDYPFKRSRNWRPQLFAGWTRALNPVGLIQDGRSS
jgi:hypothetical protein